MKKTFCLFDRTSSCHKRVVVPSLARKISYPFPKEKVKPFYFYGPGALSLTQLYLIFIQEFNDNTKQHIQLLPSCSSEASPAPITMPSEVMTSPSPSWSWSSPVAATIVMTFCGINTIHCNCDHFCFL